MAPIVVELELERERKLERKLKLSGGVFCPGGLRPFPPSSMRIRILPCRLSVPSNDKLGPVAPRGVDPRSPNFQGM